MADGSAEFHVMMSGDDEISGPANSADASLAAIVEQLKLLNQSADVTNYQLGAANDQLEQTGETSKKAGLSMSDLNAGMEVVNKALGYAQQAYEMTIGKAESYIETVRDLKAITGESAEETSRLIQVADDFQISADDLTASMRVLTKNGLVPNKETIIDLAKQYQAIQDPLKKNEFLIQNLGRASTGYTNLLSQNTDELSRNFDAVNESLVLNDEVLKQGEALRLAQDTLNDTYEAFQIAIGTKLLVPFTAWVNLVTRLVSGDSSLSLLNFQITDLLGGIGILGNLTTDYADSLRVTEEGIANTTTAMQTHTEAVEIDAEAVKAASDANTGYINMLDQTQSKLDGYTKRHGELAAERMKVEQEIAAEERNASDSTGQKLDSLNQKLHEIGQSEAELQKQRDMDQEKFIQQQLEKILSIGGLSEAEAKYLVDRGVKQGLYTEEAKKALDTALEEAKAAAADQRVEEEKQLALRQEGFKKYTEMTKGMIDENVGKNEEWLASLASIPAEMKTVITAEYVKKIVDDGTGDDTGGESQTLRTGRAASGRTVNYYITNAYIGADHELSEMSPAG